MQEHQRSAWTVCNVSRPRLQYNQELARSIVTRASAFAMKNVENISLLSTSKIKIFDYLL